MQVNGLYRKDYGRANRGKPFEDVLKMANGRYQCDGIACVHKVPTEFIPLRDLTGQVYSCKVENKSCVDYLGRYHGIPVAVEAKHTENNRIEFSEVQNHQAEFLDDWIKDPEAVALIVVSFGLRDFFTVPWQFWKAARDDWKRSKGRLKPIVDAYGWLWKAPGMASVSREQLLPEWRIAPGGCYMLHYLGVVDAIRGGMLHG